MIQFSQLHKQEPMAKSLWPALFYDKMFKAGLVHALPQAWSQHSPEELWLLFMENGVSGPQSGCQSAHWARLVIVSEPLQ